MIFHKVDEIGDRWESHFVRIGYQNLQNISCSVYTTKTSVNFSRFSITYRKHKCTRIHYNVYITPTDSHKT